MSNFGIIADKRYLRHEAPPGHPECEDRLNSIYTMIEKEGWDHRLAVVQPRLATEEELRLIHTPDHIGNVARTAGRSPTHLDPDTYTHPESFETARLAAGGLIAMTEKIMQGELSRGFAFIRPPGHHAETDRAMGFCLFNNAAIAARFARTKLGAKKILIFDWDLHHGNGTQHAFYSDPTVLYFSTHQFPYYPGTGSFAEKGAGEGEGFTMNVPLPAGQGDEEYAAAMRFVLRPVAEQFAPDLLLVSCGFDTFEEDPLGGMLVTAAGFGRLAAEARCIADDVCGGRLLLALEGGYHLRGLAESANAVLLALTDAAPPPLPEPNPAAPPPLPEPNPNEETREALRRVAAAHGGKWKTALPWTG